MKYVTPILLVVLACSLSSCSYLQNRFFSQKATETKSERKKELPPLYLGTVHQVYPAQKFALLRIIGPVPRPGVTLISHPADGSTARMGNLCISADSSPNRGIVVADIRAGAVESGDRVFLYRNIARQEEKTAQTDALHDDVVTESPVVTPVAERGLPAVLPSVRKPTVPTTTASGYSPLQQGGASTSAADEPRSNDGGVEVTTPPASVPQGPLRQPAMPNLPDKAPSYLDDIPNDINQWD